MKEKPDRQWKNGDGQVFDGYDNGEGRTAWYHHGSDQLDSVTPTPGDFEQNENDWNR